MWWYLIRLRPKREIQADAPPSPDPSTGIRNSIDIRASTPVGRASTDGLFPLRGVRLDPATIPRAPIIAGLLSGGARARHSLGVADNVLFQQQPEPRVA
jgi:hypothetical protein